MERQYQPLRKLELMITVKYAFFNCEGRYHRELSSPTEDRLFVRTRNGLTVGVLCDGAGSTGHGGEAARLTAELLCDLLADHFDRWFIDPTQNVRSHIIRELESTLATYANFFRIPQNQLACTILAAAVADDGRCICLHLGDGILLEKSKASDRPSVVSYPMTGLVRHSTYLTMNNDLHTHLRFYRWTEPDLEQILMMTDGAAEHVLRRHEEDGWCLKAGFTMEPEQILSRLKKIAPEDDHSALLIRRAQYLPLGGTRYVLRKQSDQRRTEPCAKNH